MPLGFDEPLYVMPFDHRASFQDKMFGWKGALSAEQVARVAAAKGVVYDGFKAAIAAGLPRRKAAILVDERFGDAILRDALAEGYAFACPAEASGQEEFEFEYGEDFARHIEAFRPTFCKVLVRYNPEGDPALNERQARRLRRLSDYLHEVSRRRFMFEMLVPAEKTQLERLHGDKRAYDLELRPRLMVEAIQELKDAGVEPGSRHRETAGAADEELAHGDAHLGGDAHVIFNAYWEPLSFELPPADDGAGRRWRRWIDTFLDSPEDIVEWEGAPVVGGTSYRAEPRSVVVLFSGLARS
jgi:hypothetical protein